MLQLTGDYFEAKFVVATTDYDSGGGGGSGSGGNASRAGTGSASAAPVKREQSESVPPGAARGSGVGPSRNGAPAQARRPLFNAPTPSPAPAAAAARAQFDDDDEDEYGGGVDADQLGFDDLDAAFAQIDQVSQSYELAMSQHAPSQPARRVLVSETTPGRDDEGEEGAWARTQLGPTQTPLVDGREGSAGASREASKSTSGVGGSAEEREREAKRVRSSASAISLGVRPGGVLTPRLDALVTGTLEPHGGHVSGKGGAGLRGRRRRLLLFVPLHSRSHAAPTDTNSALRLRKRECD